MVYRNSVAPSTRTDSFQSIIFFSSISILFVFFSSKPPEKWLYCFCFKLEVGRGCAVPARGATLTNGIPPFPTWRTRIHSLIWSRKLKYTILPNSHSRNAGSFGGGYTKVFTSLCAEVSLGWGGGGSRCR